MSALIAWNDWVKASTLTVLGTATELLPVENAQDRRLAIPARFARPAGSGVAQIIVDFPSSLPVRVVALLAHTITTAFPVYEIRLKAGAGATGATVWYSGAGLFPWVPPVDGFPRNQVHVLPEGLSGMSLLIEIYGPLGAWEFDIGRIWAGPALVLDDSQGLGIDFNWTQLLEDDNKVERSRGRQVYVDETPSGRTFQASVSQLPFELCFNTEGAPSDPSFQLLGFECGLGGEVIVLPRLGSNHEIHRLGIYGELHKHIQISHTSGDYFSTSLQVRETR